MNSQHIYRKWFKGKAIKLFSREYGSEAGIYSGSIAFQLLQEVNSSQSCKPVFGTSKGNSRVLVLVFVENAVVSVECLEVLVLTIEVVHKAIKPLGLKSFRGQDEGRVKRPTVCRDAHRARGLY